uniref:RNase H type-1 domain-containing protein n=1 Tax=Ananas comosus var. bracteatus TaxID=296719 RepID=A0A6V7P886_ANACO|nr:unnamed protein product [Ananas comosus var. bracteatus]
MYKLIGDGKDTTIWDDPWIFSIPLSWKPTYINMNVPFGKKKVARLIRAGNWNYDRLVEWFGPILAHNICKIILSPDNGSDEWIWAPKKDGKPSVKSIYHHINQGFYVPQATKWKVLWSLPVAPRVKNFLWKLLWNRLPTNERCYSLNSAPSPFCIYCSTPEDQNHIFLDCINARRIWDAVMSSTGILFSFNGDWITEEWIDEGKNLAVVQQQFICALIANTFWQIWKERNARQFSNNSSSIQVILCHIMHMTLDYISKIPSHTIEHSNANKWCPPPDGWIKINTDASFKSEEGTAAIGYIARTNLGHVVFAAGRQIEANSVLEAEAKAMKEAIAEAHQHGLQRVCLESDSSLLIQCLQHAQLPPWPLRALVLGISNTMKKFAATQVLFVKREANMVADWLATRANLPQSLLFTNANRHPELCKDHPPDLASLVPSELPSLPESVVENDTPAQLSAQNNVPKEKKPKHPPEASNQPNVQSSTTKKAECTTDPLAEATDIEKFVKEILEKISPAFVTEMTKNLSIETEKLSESSISDGVRRRVTSDLQSMAMILKNAAYTEGFHAGFEAVIHSGLKGRSPRK